MGTYSILVRAGDDFTFLVPVDPGAQRVRALAAMGDASGLDGQQSANNFSLDAMAFAVETPQPFICYLCVDRTDTGGALRHFSGSRGLRAVRPICELRRNRRDPHATGTFVHEQ